MFVPLSDDNPLRSIRYPFVTIGLIALNVIAYLAELTPSGQRAVTSFALIPAELFGAGFPGGLSHGHGDALPVPEIVTLVSYMFLHGDPMHLIGNMLFLWVFGDNVEDAVGHARFVVFYLACGIAGALTHAVCALQGAPGLIAKPVVGLAGATAGNIPLIGASAAVAGVIAAYLMLHPYVRVWVLAFRFIPLRISAFWALGAWIATQFVMLAVPDVGPVAWWAHVGGILCGAVLIAFLRRKGVPLFDRPHPAAAG